jgi:universal stress protein E
VKIAVGIDFSPESELAARQALEIARHVGGELVLVHVAGSLEPPPPVPRTDPSLHAAVEAYRKTITRSVAAARERLGEVRARWSGQGPEVSQVLAEGFPDTALVAAAGELGADLIAVGTHGLSGLRWFFLGSVAQHVVRLASTDVLVARGDHSGRGGYRRVLVAFDFSPAAEDALDRATLLAARDAEIDVVHFESIFTSHGPTGAGHGAGAQEEERLVTALEAGGRELVAARSRPGGPTLRFEVRRGRAVTGLMRAFDARAYDLVALGSHGRRGFRRAVLGSVAETVVRRAPCSVLVARGGAQPAAG